METSIEEWLFFPDQIQVNSRNVVLHAAALLLALTARTEGTFGVMTVDEYLTA